MTALKIFFAYFSQNRKKRGESLFIYSENKEQSTKFKMILCRTRSQMFFLTLLNYAKEIKSRQLQLLQLFLRPRTKNRFAYLVYCKEFLAIFLNPKKG